MGQMQAIALPGNHETTFKTFVNNQGDQRGRSWQEWIKVYQNGKVTFNSYQRPQPQKPIPVWDYCPKIGDDRALPRPQAVEIVNGLPWMGIKVPPFSCS
jgi:hypothetical protein